MQPTGSEQFGRLDGELAIYRDQLAEIERERAAGTLPESEAAAAVNDDTPGTTSYGTPNPSNRRICSAVAP